MNAAVFESRLGATALGEVDMQVAYELAPVIAEIIFGALSRHASARRVHARLRLWAVGRCRGNGQGHARRSPGICEATRRPALREFLELLKLDRGSGAVPVEAEAMSVVEG